MHAEARAFVASVVEGERYRRVVEVGGRFINGGVRDLLDCEEYTCVDLEPGEGVDVVADCRFWTPPAKVDLVLSLEVLEHAPEPQAVVGACIDYLAWGGRLVVTCAGPGRAPHSGHDGGPVLVDEHYGNISPADLRDWLADLSDVRLEYHPSRGDVYATGVVW